MEKNDIPEAAWVLSVAMLDNPLHVALFQGNDENTRLEIEKMFSKLFDEVPGIVFLAKDGSTLLGVMRMKSCDGRKAPDGPEGPPDENDLNWRETVWLREWARHDPTDQHWHLGPIGVLPAHHGSGIGSKLMLRFCREVDACRANAYLETDLERNVRFYEKFGFKIVSRSAIFDVKNYYMVRTSTA
jgi:ribosomal protein S18 acetylase RimI-like enzyme